MKSPRTDKLTKLTKPYEGNRCKDGVIPATRSGRLAFVAETLGVTMPSDLPADLLDADGGPATVVRTFCVTHGVSLDFIYLGNVAIMARYAAKALNRTSAILDAQDEIGRARDLVRLIQMGADHPATDNGRAVSAGCEAILGRLEAAIETLRAQVRGEAA